MELFLKHYERLKTKPGVHKLSPIKRTLLIKENSKIQTRFEFTTTYEINWSYRKYARQKTVRTIDGTASEELLKKVLTISN